MTRRLLRQAMRRVWQHLAYWHQRRQPVAEPTPAVRAVRERVAAMRAARQR